MEACPCLARGRRHLSVIGLLPPILQDLITFLKKLRQRILGSSPSLDLVQVLCAACVRSLDLAVTQGDSSASLRQFRWLDQGQNRVSRTTALQQKSPRSAAVGAFTSHT